jgi:hypothetical protein
MTGPIVFISHSRVRDGQFEALREMAPPNFSAIQADKPGTVVFLGYADEARASVDFIHVFPNAEAFDRHLEGVEERMGKVMGFIELRGYEIYGQPSEQTMTAMRGFAAELGVPLEHHPVELGGYVRPGGPDPVVRS